MIELTFCELRDKEVVNMSDGKRLGRIIDLALTAAGQVLGIVVPGDRTFFRSFAGSDSIFIPWKNVIKIGDDVILVELLAAGAC